MDVQQNTTFLTHQSAWTLRLGKYIEPWVPVRQFRQLDYVAANSPAVVTLTVGGNDIRFPSIATRCEVNSVLPRPSPVRWTRIQCSWRSRRGANVNLGTVFTTALSTRMWLYVGRSQAEVNFYPELSLSDLISRYTVTSGTLS